MKQHQNKKSSGSARIALLLGSVLVFFVILVILLRKIPHTPLGLGSLKVPTRSNFKIRKQPDDAVKLFPIDTISKTGFSNTDSYPLQSAVVHKESTLTTVKPTRSATSKVTTVKAVQVVKPPPQSLGLDTVLLVICGDNRPEYLTRTLQHVLKYHPLTSVPIVVSEDGSGSVQVRRVVESAQKTFVERGGTVPFLHIHHVNDRNVQYENGYFKLADHFKWALNQVFGDSEKLFAASDPSAQVVPQQVSRVIILEEDLQIAPDFFEFFGATMHLLDHDESVLAVSAWNDNGMRALVRDNKALYRSDFFPGLGWMLSRRLWVNELASKWPRAYWDDWLREPKQRQGRHIIRPEVCRTLHFGTHGVSNAQYSDYLNTIFLNEEFVSFSSLDLNYLTKAAWDRDFIGRVTRAPLIATRDWDSVRGQGVAEVRVGYTDLENSFPRLAHWAGAMDNVKANVPRTAYRGIVSVWKGDVKVHLVPKEFSN